MADERFRVRVDTEKMLIDMGDGTHAERVLANPPAEMITDANRLRVDQGSTGFWLGREFRLCRPLTIAAGAKYVIRFTSLVDFILHYQSLAVDAGFIQFQAFRAGTEGGVWTELPVHENNFMDSAPHYDSQITVEAGGTFDPGSNPCVETIRARTAGATAQQVTVGMATSGERGMPPGTYWLVMSNPGTGDATGVYTVIWEERP